MVIGTVVEYLTFGRPRLFVFSSLAGLGGTLAFVSREMLIPAPTNEAAVIAVSLGLILAFGLGVFWALSSIGTLTYCPRFHQPRHIAISFLLYMILAALLVLFGYLVFVFTVVQRMPNTTAEFAVGGVFVSFVAFLLAAAQYGLVWREQDYRRKQQLVDDVLEAVQAISRCDRDEVSSHVQALGSSLQEVEQHLRDEPFAECEELRESVDEWRIELREATDSGARKMVDESVVFADREVVDSDPYWEGKRQEFEQIHNDLYVMSGSALHKLDPRHD